MMIIEERNFTETTINRDTKIMVVQQVNLVQIITEVKGKKDFLSINFSIFWFGIEKRVVSFDDSFTVSKYFYCGLL